MLDALFGTQGSKNQQQDELQALIAQAREERTMLSAMLTQMAGGTSKLAQTSKALEQVGQKADAALRRLDDLGQKVTGYEDRSKGLEQIEKRIAALLEQVHEAQRVSEKITAPDGELQKHRLAVNQLASQALENQATIETLRKERSSFEDLRGLLKASTADVSRSVESVATLKGELDAIRSTGHAVDGGVHAAARNVAQKRKTIPRRRWKRSRRSRRSSDRWCSCRSSARTPRSASRR